MGDNDMNHNEVEYFSAEESRRIRERQAARSRVLALILGGLCVLFFAITVVKVSYWG